MNAVMSNSDNPTPARQVLRFRCRHQLPSAMIRYHVEFADAHAHRFGVTMTLDTPAARQRVSMPVWIPGSYLVREFARHVSGLSATQNGKPVALKQIDKASWLAACTPEEPLVLRYSVYAFDTSVRAAFLDAQRGFFNGTSLLFAVDGRLDELHRLTLGVLPEGWDVATTLPAAEVDSMAAGAPGTRTFAAENYDELVDHPVELGRFWRGAFTAHGVPHEFVVCGALPDFDGERLLADTRRICESEIAFWHADRKAPFGRYLFMLNAVEDGRGGLEHRASTALIAPRRDLPRRDMVGVSDGYVDLLGLISHEYFHTWNVKRLKPRDFASFDYSRENYTELLWFFEGFTSYYDDLTLVRAGLIDDTRYLAMLAKTVSTVLAAPGRHVQSVAESSFDAWVKYYRSDENTPNATISYYAKGSLVALAFDLTLRAAGRGSLDEVMRALWASSCGGPIDESDIAAALERIGGRSMARELADWVQGTDDLPLEGLLKSIGVDWQAQTGTLAQRLGVRVAESALTGVKVSHVLRGHAGERAGLASGDELLAVNSWRVRRLEDALRVLPDDGDAKFLIARDQRVFELTLTLPAASAAPAINVTLKPTADVSAEVAGARLSWLHG